MSSSYAEIISRIETAVSGRGGDPTQSPLVDGAAMTAESVFPLALRYVYRKAIAEGENLLNLAQNFTVTLAAGTGTLPVTILPEFLRSHSKLPAVPFSSWLDYADFTKAKLTTLLKYYSANGDNFYYSDTAAVSVVLNAVAIPAIPNDPDEDVEFSAHVTESAIAVVCAVLTGEMPFAELARMRFT